MIDRIHFWLYHQFDVGMRMTKNIIDIEENDGMEEQKTKDQHFDRIFAKMKKEITKKRNKWKSDHIQCDKYTMKVQNIERVTMINDENDEYTFIDSIFEELQQEETPLAVLDSFRRYNS